jgi:homoserine O-acetyltransferase
MTQGALVGLSRGLAAAAFLSLLIGVAPVSAADEADGRRVDGEASYQPHDVAYENYRFRDGETLPSLRLHYLTLGAPHRNAAGEIDNAVLILHWTGADSAAVTNRLFTATLYASGKPLDAARYFLIFPDAVGAGQTAKPSDGLRAKFPRYVYGDMVDIQHKLVTQTLGIRRLHAIFGMSMGGMNAWAWAEQYPGAMDGIMPVVSLPIKVSGRNAIWRRLAIDMIRDDPAYDDGNYVGPVPAVGRALGLLRMMIDSVAHLQDVAPDAAKADEFLAQVTSGARSTDANDLLYALRASEDYDPEPHLSTIRTKVFALNFDDDEFNPDRLGYLEALTPTLPGARYVVQKATAASLGHLTMTRPDLWANPVGDFMKMLEAPGN